MSNNPAILHGLRGFFVLGLNKLIRDVSRADQRPVQYIFAAQELRRCNHGVRSALFSLAAKDNLIRQASLSLQLSSHTLKSVPISDIF